MDIASGISFLVAFGTGLISFLSPCVLPLVPSYMSVISGASYEELRGLAAGQSGLRRAIFAHAVLFVLGVLKLRPFLRELRLIKLTGKPLGVLGPFLVGLSWVCPTFYTCGTSQ